jgi:Mg-chelatase subunit ChlD
MRNDTSGTSYRDALGTSRTVFENNSRGGTVKKVMIFISDGIPNPGQTDAEIVALSNDLKNRLGVEVYAVGIKANGQSYANTMKGMVSNPQGQHYTSAETEDNYAQFFADVQADVACS